MDFITWCNDNSGFMSAVLSFIGLVVSGIAIAVSVNTARLPYKKKLKLCTDEVAVKSKISSSRYRTASSGILISCVNIGSRDILLTGLGICAKCSSHAKKVHGIAWERYPIEGAEGSITSVIVPAKAKTLYLLRDRLQKAFINISEKDKIYLYAKDSEGKEYYKKIMNYSEFYELYLKD
ncbi:MAG: hypothetical protein LUG86_07860 [Oscillospiraceae bacterium]|nr:hypothetical protein [Oscillospiraceae bacterium]